jgi:DNA-binding transcriptional regulator LsrR (DeoR family)
MIRREYWWQGHLQKHLAEVFGIAKSYVSMLVRGKSRPDAPGPTSERDPSLPSPHVQREIRFLVFESGATVTSIVRAYGLPRLMVKIILRDGVQQGGDSATTDSTSTE